MAFREFIVVVLLAVITHSYKVRRTEDSSSRYIIHSNQMPHSTRHNVDTMESDAGPVVLKQNNYHGNGPAIQTNYRAAVQNNFGNDPYRNTGNVNGFDGKRQGEIYDMNNGVFVQNNYGRADTHWDGMAGNVNYVTGRQEERNRGGENVFGGFRQTNLNSHVVNNFGGYNIPNTLDIGTQDQATKPLATGSGFTFDQHNFNSPVYEVYPQNSDEIVIRNKFPSNAYALPNLWAGINEGIRNNLAEVQRHLHNTMDNLKTQLGQIPYNYNNGYYWNFNPGFKPIDYGTNFNYWSITPGLYLDPGRKPTGHGIGSSGAGMSPTEGRPVQEPFGSGTPGVDHCSTGHRCDGNATCMNLNTNYICMCNQGYHGDGYTCEDVDECQQQGGRFGHHCHSNTRCVNMAGGYMCQCLPGYTRKDKFNCVEEDECASDKHRCHADAVCTNTPGSYMCQCRDGYTGDGYNCIRVDHCSTGHRCDGNATCINLNTKYVCMCNQGYHGDGYTCEDVDECQQQGGRFEHHCHSNTRCVNMVGGYMCQCLPGYTRKDKFNCVEEDECASDKHGCHADAVCTNTPGSYMCQCRDGYTGDGYNCIRGQNIPDNNGFDYYDPNDPRKYDGGATTGPYPGTTYRPSTNNNDNGVPAAVDPTRHQQGGRPQVEMDGNGHDGYSSNDKKIKW